jgi:hypothetical protein
MGVAQDRGRAGEALAAAYLELMGCRLVARRPGCWSRCACALAAITAERPRRWGRPSAIACVARRRCSSSRVCATLAWM